MSNQPLWNESFPTFRAGGEFTFDFAMLLVLAGAIAFMGLLEDSSVVLVASMLVSPLMGPILAGVFGTVIRDASLRNQGVRHELAALVVCVVIGFLLGLAFAPWVAAYGVARWPTEEMLGRGKIRSLFVGELEKGQKMEAEKVHKFKN